MASSKNVEWSKLCKSCATKKAIAMLSSSSSSIVDEGICGCIDPGCLNFRDPMNVGRSQENSPTGELTEAQRFVLAHLQRNETKGTEKLKKLLAIPCRRMNEEQRRSAQEELGKFEQDVYELVEDISEEIILLISKNNNGH